jgi:hypothetical protein
MRWNRRARAESESAGLSWQQPRASTTSSYRQALATGPACCQVSITADEMPTSSLRPLNIHLAFAIAGSSLAASLLRRDGCWSSSGRSANCQ